MARLRIVEALGYYAANNGKRMTQDELASYIWPSSSKESRNININKLINGRTKRVDIDAIKTICKTTGVDANFLLNMKPMEE